MIVGCYTLDLYCEVADNHSHGEVGTYGYADQFTGPTGPKCREQSRDAGWRLDVRRGLALCPKCVAGGMTLTKVIRALDTPAKGE